MEQFGQLNDGADRVSWRREKLMKVRRYLKSLCGNLSTFA
jgi:hypothetical protein